MARWVLAGLAIALVVTASAAAYFYSVTLTQSDELSAQGSQLAALRADLTGDARAISLLNSTLFSKNATIAQLRSEVDSLNARIVSLSLQVSSLQSNQTALNANLTATRGEIGALESQLSGLRNDSAQLQLELTLAGQVKGWFVYSYFINMTWTVPANSTILLVNDANGYNGTVVLLAQGDTACGILGTSGIQGMQGFDLLVEGGPPRSGGGEFLSLQKVGPAEFSVGAINEGSQSASCVLSVLYVYQGTPAF